jgi:hypothetical protein
MAPDESERGPRRGSPSPSASSPGGRTVLCQRASTTRSYGALCQEPDNPTSIEDTSRVAWDAPDSAATVYNPRDGCAQQAIPLEVARRQPHIYDPQPKTTRDPQHPTNSVLLSHAQRAGRPPSFTHLAHSHQRAGPDANDSGSKRATAKGGSP